ncbi:hypothetical protein [Tengunoibacter tsumagoiensis]|uniref:hypothetical protein n=1 Tax=Tengunoibacter tsumagoiensis TaxID=2014871 RepID=UPI001FE9C229|nr:hypothetical protein [Tengunoibacter tsumagoiensis]
MITDEFMQQTLATTKPCSVMVLKVGPNRQKPGAEAIVWEHGRRNFLLSTQNLLWLACPISDESNLAGIGIFNTDVEEVKKVMDEDPGVKAGVFVYEVHSSVYFDGRTLALKEASKL